MSTSNGPEFLRAGLQWMRTAWGQGGMLMNGAGCAMFGVNYFFEQLSRLILMCGIECTGYRTSCCEIPTAT